MEQDNTKQNRECGFYFVDFSGNRRPAYWNGSKWHVWGNIGYWNDEHCKNPVPCVEIDETRIVRPEASVEVGTECMYCGDLVPGAIPKMCCDGRDCGCRGLPTEPIVCSKGCYEMLETKYKIQPSIEKRREEAEQKLSETIKTYNSTLSQAYYWFEFDESETKLFVDMMLDFAQSTDTRKFTKEEMKTAFFDGVQEFDNSENHAQEMRNPEQWFNQKYGE